MSVSVDKYFGWTIDLKTDLNCNDFDFYHKFIDKGDENLYCNVLINNGR